MRDRLRESVLVRVVAASLLVHLVVGPPVLAWVLLHERETEPEIFVRVENREDPGFDDELEEETLPLQPLSLEPEMMAVRDAENHLRRARYLLDSARGGWPAPSDPVPGATEPLEIRLLDARSRWLHDGQWPDWLDEERFERGVEGPQLALYVELLLDRFVQTGERGAAVPWRHGPTWRFQGQR